MFSKQKPTWNPADTLLVAIVLAAVAGPVAQADFTFGTPTNLGPTVNCSAHDYFACISPDGLELYFSSNRPGGYGSYDIWVTTRASEQDPWGPPVNLGPEINNSGWEAPGSISADGLTLYFESSGLYTTTRAARDAPWGPRVSLGSVVNISGQRCEPVISADGLELFFSAISPGGCGGWDIWVSTRATISDAWGTPVNIGATINTPFHDLCTWISPDGLTLLLASDRPGGFGNFDVWMTTRPSKGGAWGPPKNLGPSINTMYVDEIISVSSDGRWCYLDDFGSARPGGVGMTDIWQAPIMPMVDFNGDSKVDRADLAVLLANWGKNQPLCDIGPFPWGDGIVDEKDLAVLMESLVTPGPHATEVPRDVVLSWASVPLVQSYDVYFGTVEAIVSAASRATPLGVLTSQGQPTATYDPAGLLEPSRTYYWRVDFVSPGPAPTIYKGPVLDFTTEGLTSPIKNVTATASTSQRGMGPEKTVDGSGLDKNDGHSTDGADMWLSTSTQPNWIQYQFDKVYTLHEMWVWNSNPAVEPFIGFGAKSVKIEYSTDGTTWTPLANVPEFARAPGQPGYKPNTTVSFGGVSAKFVKLTIEKNWGAAQPTGLSEVRFFYIPSATVPKP
jgi:hypothetical protein